MKRFAVSLSAFLVVCCLHLAPAAADDTYQVYILAGQSNMEGKASNDLLEHQATQPETEEIFAAFRKDGKWVERDDAFIKFLDRHGPLTMGYG